MRSKSTPPAPKPCKVCGQLFERHPGEAWVRFAGRRTCSIQCATKLAKQTRLEQGIDPPKVRIVCAVCGKSFECKPSDQISALGYAKRFCSRACHGIARRRMDWSYPTPGQAEYVCPICGRTKIRWKYQPPTTCSHRCNALMRAQQRGRDKPTVLERAVADALLEMGVAHESQAIVYPYVVDFLLEDRRIVVECLGDYAHANPSRYPTPIDDRQRKAIERDALRFATLEAGGYRVVKLWQSDIQRCGARALLEGAI